MPISIPKLLDVLREEHGDPGWWPGDTPFEVAVGAILTQNTAWRNVEIAIRNLKSHGLLSPKALLSISKPRLEREIRPAGFYRQKSRYLIAFARYLRDKYGGDMHRMHRVPLDELRRELLEIPGIGEETADEILLYGLGKPSFVVDRYTRRLLERLGLDLGDSYGSIKKGFEKALGGDVHSLADMHALIVMHCKEGCSKLLPSCNSCPLGKRCVSVSGDHKKKHVPKYD